MRPLKVGSDCYDILQALKKGPRTNGYFIWTLRIPKYTNRISDLRKRGYIITAEALCVTEGLWRYHYKGRAQV